MENYFQNRNVLITGGLGFIGSNIALKLIQYGANITIIDNMNPLYGGNLFNVRDIKENIQIIIDDVENNEKMLALIENTDIIYHFAAQVSYIDSLNMPYVDLALNARTTLNILECCRKLNPKAKIIFSSSRMVYGRVNSSLIREDAATNPLSLYGIHKLTSEKYLTMYYKDFGIPGIGFRITNPYGPRQQIKHSKYSLVGWFIRKAMEGEVIKIFGDGNQLRDYIYIEDIVDAMIRCTQEEKAIGEIINLGSGISTRFRDMIKIIINCVGKGSVEFVEWPENYEKVETGDIKVDIYKLKSIISWEPRFTLEKGIQETYKYYSNYSDKYY